LRTKLLSKPGTNVVRGIADVQDAGSAAIAQIRVSLKGRIDAGRVWRIYRSRRVECALR
jgi:hypothetical protein